MPKTYESIARTVLSTSSSAVTFSSITNQYTDLVLILHVRDNSAGTQFSNIQLTYNGDIGNNYSAVDLYGNGSAATSFGLPNRDRAWVSYMSSKIDIYSSIAINIMNYSNTNIFKTSIIRSSFGTTSPNTTSLDEHVVSTWRNTSAINSIVVNGAVSFAPGSTFTLYGIKAA